MFSALRQQVSEEVSVEDNNVAQNRLSAELCIASSNLFTVKHYTFEKHKHLISPNKHRHSACPRLNTLILFESIYI